MIIRVFPKVQILDAMDVAAVVVVMVVVEITGCSVNVVVDV